MHEEADELLALYALGALGGADLTRVERHLAEGCGECLRTLASFERAVARVGHSVAPVQPPAALRGRVLDVSAVRQPDAPPAPAPLPFAPREDAGRTRPRAGPLAAAVLLAAAAAVAIAFLTWSLVAAGDRLDAAVRELADARETNDRLAERLAERDRLLGTAREPGVRLTRLSAPGEAPEPSVEVYWNPQREAGVLVARHLPSVEPSRTYELWLIAGAAPVPAATFNTDEHGTAVVEIGELPAGADPQKFAITVEPAGGSPAPTTPIVFVGDYGA